MESCFEGRTRKQGSLVTWYSFPVEESVIVVNQDVRMHIVLQVYWHKITGSHWMHLRKNWKWWWKTLQTWNEYLDHLAVLISNLRMAYDMDIILGGDVGGVLSDYMIPLGEKVMAYNGFEHDVSYLKNCSYKKEASAVGAAKYFFTKHMVEL